MDETRFKQGFTWNEYLENLNQNVEELKKDRDEAEEYLQALPDNYDRVLVSDDARDYVTSISDKIHLVALAEYWCSDARANLPVMVRIAELNPNIELRIFPRDENKELMQNYLFRGKSMSIPAFGFFDANFNEFGKWLGGKPKICWDWIKELGMEESNQKIRDFNIENRGQETLKEFIEIIRSR